MVLGNGRLQVTVSVNSHAGFTPNTLKSIAFQQARNATYEIPGQAASVGPVTASYPSGAAQTTFVVRRTAPGAVQANFTVTDNCGAWPTFVGAGPSAGW